MSRSATSPEAHHPVDLYISLGLAAGGIMLGAFMLSVPEAYAGEESMNKSSGNLGLSLLIGSALMGIVALGTGGTGVPRHAPIKL